MQSDDRFKSYIAGQKAFGDLLPIGVYFCAKDGALLSFNRQCALFWGAEPQAHGGQFGTGCKVYEPDGRPLAASDDPMTLVLNTGMPVEGRELIFERMDGSRIFVDVNAKPIFEHEVLAGGIVCIQDISKRKQAEVRLESQHSLLAAVVDAMPECVQIVTSDGKLEQINAAGLKLLDIEALASVDGLPVASLVVPDDREQWLANHKRVCNGESLTWAFDIIGSSGARRPMETHAVPIRFPDGQTGQFAITRNLTDVHRDDLQAARLAAIVTSSDDAIVSKTLEGFITSWNVGAERIFGYSAEEMIGQHITRIVPPELQSEEEDILSRLRRGEHVDHFETVRIAKDGRRVDVSVTVSPMRDKSGKLFGASKVGRDITERKHSERLQRLLVSELNHRVKNTLATVQSIANQMAYRAKTADEFAASFGGRLQGLARTHNLLTQSTWQGAELSDIVRDQLPSGDERISYSGPGVMLNAQAALHLGLVLHELATNAMKYGALSDRRGRLVIRWSLENAGGRHLVLQWREQGGPSVELPKSQGFGTILIEKSLEAHGGVTSIDYDPKGLICDIKLPVPESEICSGGSYGKRVMDVADPVQAYHDVHSIAGKRILVVDDEPLIAMDIVASLENAGCEVVGPAATLEKALNIIERDDIDAALLDANLAGDPVDLVAAALVKRQIPFAFVSGYGSDGLPKAYRNAMLVKKPFQREQLIDVIQQLLTETQVSLVKAT